MELIEDALSVAARQASGADVELREPDGVGTYDALVKLLDRTWGRSPEAGHVIPRELVIAIRSAGGQVSVAERDGDVVGATVAMIGRTDDGEQILHSHVTAVDPDLQTRGVGTALKWHQRAWALTRGIEEVRWSYDPLIRRNAHLNLIKLGARPVGYVENLYGPMDDELNAGLPTDRFLVTWKLTERRVVAAAAGATAEPDLSAIRRVGAQEILRTTASDDPVAVLEIAGDRLLAQVPNDIEGLRRRNPKLAASWAEASRRTLGAAVNAGYRVTGFTYDGWYVLAAPRGVDELAGGTADPS